MALGVLLLLLAYSRPALAYLDPGTSNLVLQVVVAGLVAASVALRRFWSRVVGGALRLLRRPSPPTPSGDDGGR